MILIHASPFKIKKLKYVSQYDCKSSMAGIKPCGLWFSPGKDWLRWCKEELPEHCKTYKFFYVVVPKYTTLEKPNQNKVLKIQNEKEFDEFNFKYGYMTTDKNYSEISSIYIKWNDVEKNFGGIEIIPFIKNRNSLLLNSDANGKELREKYEKNGFVFGSSNSSGFWYSFFDVASGCIWNPQAIKKFYQIKKEFKVHDGKNKKELVLVKMK